MPRGRHVGLVRSDREINAAIENVARYHILAVRRRVDGSITSIKHVQFGWISPKIYYQLQKIHDFTPIIVSVIEGGYRLKAAIWAYEIPLEVLGSGSGIPISVILIIVAAALYAEDTATGNKLYAWIDLASLALPFGELWLLWRGVDIIMNLLAPIKGALGNLGNALPSGWNFFDWSAQQDFLMALFGGPTFFLQFGLDKLYQQLAISAVESPEAAQIWANLQAIWNYKPGATYQYPVNPPPSGSGYDSSGNLIYYPSSSEALCQAGFVLLYKTDSSGTAYMCVKNDPADLEGFLSSGWTYAPSSRHGGSKPP